MTERSLSAIYQTAIMRDAKGADAEDLLGLSAAGAVDPTVLDRLARTPDAAAVYGIARALPFWSNAIAEDLRSVGNSPVRASSRVRRVGWISVAAAAGFAMFIVGLRPRESTDLPIQSAMQTSATSVNPPSADIVFVDPDSAMLVSVPANAGESIFTDSLDG